MKREKFEEILKKVLEHNNEDGAYGKDATISITAEECIGRWSPCDLIIREYLNNGGGSARGFLGITPRECIDAYGYLVAHKEELKPLINQNGWNNYGFSLWKDWNF